MGSDALDDTKRSGAYGVPPAELAIPTRDAVQFSPLIPGSEALESRNDSSLASLVVLAPSGTLERRYTVALALRALEPDAPLTVLAPKDKGGSRLSKELKSFGCAVSETSRRHHRICTARRPDALHGLDTALAEGAPQWVEALGLWSQPGVFSWNRVDPGSALLQRHLPALAGRGADLGCGIGYLSRTILTSPKAEHLTMIDIDRRAVGAARRNIDDPRADLVWGDVRNGDLRLSGLDFVVMNPPFHDGGAEDQALGQSFIRRAAEALRPGGACWLVANRHLPYESVLKSQFRRVALRTEESGYKIYEAHR